MTPHDAIMAAAIRFKTELFEYLAEFHPHNRSKVERFLDQLIYECSVMPNEGHEQ